MNNSRESGAVVTPHGPTLEAVQQLARVLDRMGDALAEVDTTALLAVEGELGGALTAMGAVTQMGHPAAVRAAGQQALTTLVRCRRLGASFLAIARTLERAGRVPDGYDRAGAYVERAARSSVLVSA